MQLEALLNLETHIETAWGNILTEAGGVAVPEFSDTEKKLPIYEVKLTGVSETRDKYFIYRGCQMPNQWKATLVTRTVTKRFANSDAQPEMIARVRASAFDFLARFNDDTLPNHWVTYMREISSVRQHLPEPGIDITEQHHEVMIEIRAESLPSEP